LDHSALLSYCIIDIKVNQSSVVGVFSILLFS